MSCVIPHRGVSDTMDQFSLLTPALSAGLLIFSPVQSLTSSIRLLLGLPLPLESDVALTIISLSTVSLSDLNVYSGRVMAQ